MLRSFYSLGAEMEKTEMKNNCDFECEYLDQDGGECSEIGGPCIGSFCGAFMDCWNCSRSEDCEHVHARRRGPKR